MQDLIIKGTGNSRFLKSNIPTNTTLQELIAMLNNGTFPIDLNGLNQEGIQQQGTPINTATLLADDTANTLGLTQPEPTVNDAFASIGIYNEYWWEETIGQYVATGEVQSATGYFFINQPQSTTVDITYSDSIEINQDTGEISLSNPQELTISISDIETARQTVANKYIKASLQANAQSTPVTGIFLVASESALSYTGSSASSSLFLYNNQYSLYSTKFEPTGEKVYVHSTNRYEYTNPDRYRYIGVPFDNIIDIKPWELISRVEIDEEVEGYSFDFTSINLLDYNELIFDISINIASSIGITFTVNKTTNAKSTTMSGSSVGTSNGNMGTLNNGAKTANDRILMKINHDNENVTVSTLNLLAGEYGWSRLGYSVADVSQSELSTFDLIFSGAISSGVVVTIMGVKR